MIGAETTADYTFLYFVIVSSIIAFVCWVAIYYYDTHAKIETKLKCPHCGTKMKTIHTEKRELYDCKWCDTTWKIEIIPKTLSSKEE